MEIRASNLRNMLKAISAGNHVLNETVSLYKIAKAHCPDCVFDPVRQESTNYNCETCDGTGFINTEEVFTIPASIEQEEDFKYDFSKAGKFVKGQIYLTIDSVEMTTILDPTSKYNLNDYNQMKAFIEQYEYVIWKGAKYSIQSFEPGWLQGNLYEIGFTLSIME